MRNRAYMTLLLTLAMTALALSCTKTDRVYDGNREEITMSPVMSVMSKHIGGPVSGTTYPEDETMGVFAYYCDIPAGEEWDGSEDMQTYIDNKEFVCRGGSFWGGVQPYYWPLTGSMIFVGYSPFYYVKEGDSEEKEVEGVSFDPATKKLSIEGYVTGMYQPMSLEDILDPDIEYQNTTQSDLMYFLPKFSINGNYVGTGKQESVPVNFYHALSLLTFKVKTDAGDESLISLKRIVLRNIIRKGDFSVTAEGVLRGVTSWTLHKNDDEYVDDFIIFDSGTEGESLALDTSLRTIAEVLVIPGFTHDIDVTYYLHVNGDKFEETVSISPTDIDTDPSPDSVSYLDEWKIGTRYTYNLLIGTETIEVNPVVESWTDNNL